MSYEVECLNCSRHATESLQDRMQEVYVTKIHHGTFRHSASIRNHYERPNQNNEEERR
jgi:hypothetical protein